MIVTFLLYGVCILYCCGEQTLMEQDARLIDEIAGNIVDDAISADRIVLNMKQDKVKDEEIAEVVEKLAKNTLLTVGPKLEKLTEEVLNSSQAAKNVLDVIERKTALNVARMGADNDLDLRSSFSTRDLAKSFVSMLFSGFTRFNEHD